MGFEAGAAAAAGAAGAAAAGGTALSCSLGAVLGGADGSGSSSKLRKSSVVFAVSNAEVVSGCATVSTGKDPVMSASSGMAIEPLLVVLTCATVLVLPLFPAFTRNSTAIFCRAARCGPLTDCIGASPFKD